MRHSLLPLCPYQFCSQTACCPCVLTSCAVRHSLLPLCPYQVCSETQPAAPVSLPGVQWDTACCPCVLTRCAVRHSLLSLCPYQLCSETHPAAPVSSQLMVCILCTPVPCGSLLLATVPTLKMEAVQYPWHSCQQVFEAVISWLHRLQCHYVSHLQMVTANRYEAMWPVILFPPLMCHFAHHCQCSQALLCKLWSWVFLCCTQLDCTSVICDILCFQKLYCVKHKLNVCVCFDISLYFIPGISQVVTPNRQHLHQNGSSYLWQFYQFPVPDSFTSSVCQTVLPVLCAG